MQQLGVTYFNETKKGLWQMRTTEASGCLFSDNFRNFFFTKPTTSGGAEANECDFPIEILAVNNNSTDRTEAVMQQLGVTYFNEIVPFSGVFRHSLSSNISFLPAFLYFRFLPASHSYGVLSLCFPRAMRDSEWSLPKRCRAVFPLFLSLAFIINSLK